MMREAPTAPRTGGGTCWRMRRARIETTLDITRTGEELLEAAIARLADAGAVDLLTTVLERDRHAPHAHDQKMRLRRVAVRWPARRSAPPGYLGMHGSRPTLPSCTTSRGPVPGT